MGPSDARPAEDGARPDPDGSGHAARDDDGDGRRLTAGDGGRDQEAVRDGGCGPDAPAQDSGGRGQDAVRDGGCGPDAPAQDLGGRDAARGDLRRRHAAAHDHHGHGPGAGGRHAGRLAWAFALVGSFLLVEAGAAFLTNSVALLSDAGHLLTDAVGLGMALAAIRVARSGGHRPGRTYGLYRLEILAALANAVLLVGVAGYVLFEAATRLSDPPEVLAGPMLVVGVAGLAVNLVAFALLRSGAGESLNVHAAYLEVVADTLGSAGAIVAAVVIQATGWRYVDPLVGAAIGVFILPRTWRVGGQALRVLLQSAPPDVDLAALQADLEAIDGVVDVHDVHVWTLTSAMEVASAHLMTGARTDGHAVLDQARSLLVERYGIAHATFQVEPETHEGCSEVAW